jgi:hypothetical protein
VLSLDRSIEEAKVSQETRVGRLILVPALITLGVTLLRLVGELANWSPRFFSRDAGGGAAVVGIAWLVPFFGAWFGWQLARAGSRPSSYGRAVGLTLLGFALIPAAGFGASAMGIPQASLTTLWIFVVAALLGIFVAMQAWPALGRTLLAYGLAARIPVVIVMLVAMLANWGTHYDAPPPDFPEMSTLAKWLTIGVAPQLSIWIAYTVIVGGIFGIAAAAIAGRRPATAPA